MVLTTAVFALLLSSLLCIHPAVVWTELLLITNLKSCHQLQSFIYYKELSRRGRLDYRTVVFKEQYCPTTLETKTGSGSLEMYLQRLGVITIGNFLIRKSKREKIGIISGLANNIVNGHSLWNGDEYRIVLPYGVLVLISIYQISCVLLNLHLYPENAEWFKSSLDMALCSASVILSAMNSLNKEKIRMLGEEVDKWWVYRYLVHETNSMKKNVEQNITAVSNYVRWSLYSLAAAYISLNSIAPYLLKEDRSAVDLVVFESIPDEPWVYFSIVGGMLVIHAAIVNGAYDVMYFLSILYTEISQLRLIGTALLSIDNRVSIIMSERIVNFGNYSRVYQETVHNEIKSCAQHCQAIYRKVALMHYVFTLFTNHIYYTGGLCFIGMGVLFIKMHGNDTFLVVMITTACAILTTQYLYSYANDSFANEVEKLRFTVYDMEWYDLPIPSQRSINIMQTMLLFPPQMKTIVGAPVTIEFFSKVMNAGYYYITTLLSMEIK